MVPFPEGRDYWFQAGIHREVYLNSAGKPFIDDFIVKATLDDQYKNGSLHVVTSVECSTRIEEGWTVGFKRLDRKGKNGLRKASASSVASYSAPFSFTGHVAFRLDVVVAPKVWLAESPYLYQLEVSLVDDKGSAREVVAVRIGFRRVEVKNRELLINGKAVLIKGGNRHDHDDTRGKAVSRGLMIREIRLMKQFNFNAVRTAHYPNDPVWYALYDEYGLYQIDEANSKSHALRN